MLIHVYYIKSTNTYTNRFTSNYSLPHKDTAVRRSVQKMCDLVCGAASPTLQPCPLPRWHQARATEPHFLAPKTSHNLRQAKAKGEFPALERTCHLDNYGRECSPDPECKLRKFVRGCCHKYMIKPRQNQSQTALCNTNAILNVCCISEKP